MFIRIQSYFFRILKGAFSNIILRCVSCVPAPDKVGPAKI
jgi:hypothetical protein